MITGKQLSSDRTDKIFVMVIMPSRVHAGVTQHSQKAWSQTTVRAEGVNACPTLQELRSGWAR